VWKDARRSWRCGSNRNVGPDGAGKPPGGSQSRCTLSILWYGAMCGRIGGGSVFLVSKCRSIEIQGFCGASPAWAGGVLMVMA